VCDAVFVANFQASTHYTSFLCLLLSSCIEAI
jgi:hypothetical protein